MMRHLLCVVCLVLAVVSVAEGGPQKPKKVRCHDKNYPSCRNKPLFCPDACLRTCVVDCASCQPVCIAPPPPPPSPPPPPPKAKKNKRPPPPPPPTVPFPSPPISSPSPPPPPPPPTVPFPSPPISSPSPPPLPSSQIDAAKATCNNRNYTTCYKSVHQCPTDCPYHCEVDCVTCKPVCNCNKPGAVCQDPRFIGGDGITFYFHGKKDQDFCIVSNSNLHINAHFIGKRNHHMRRDFTWVQSLGILFDNHQLSIAATKTATWNDATDHIELAFDNETVTLPEHEGATWQATTAPGVLITRTHDTNAVVLEVEGNFRIKATVVPITKEDSRVHNYGITEEDCFAHLDLGFKFFSLSGEVNGVLGQTYGENYVSRVKMGVEMPVLGGDKEFASSGLFATDCAVARFNGYKNPVVNNVEYPNLNCASGLDGRGVICKR